MTIRFAPFPSERASSTFWDPVEMALAFVVPDIVRVKAPLEHGYYVVQLDFPSLSISQADCAGPYGSQQEAEVTAAIMEAEQIDPGRKYPDRYYAAYIAVLPRVES